MMPRRSRRLNPHLPQPCPSIRTINTRKRHEWTAPPPRKRQRSAPNMLLLDLPDEVLIRIISYLTKPALRTRSLTDTSTAMSLSQTCIRLCRLTIEAFRHTKKVDAVYPGKPDGPLTHFPIATSTNLTFLSGILLNALREIRLPRIEGLQHVLDVISRCSNLEKLSFVDGESVSAKLARRVFANKPALDFIEITEPGTKILSAFAELSVATDVALLGVRARRFEMLKKVLRTSGRRLRRFGIGFNADEIRIRNADAVTTAKSLLNYLVNYVKRDMPHITYFRLVCNLAGSWFLSYMQRLVALLCPTTDVEIVVMGMPLVFPTLRDGMSESYHRSISLLMIARLPPNIVMHAYSDGIFKPDTVELNGHHDHLVQYLRGGDDVRNSVAAIVAKAKPHLRRLQVQFTCVSVQGFRLVVKCLSDIMKLAPGISEIEVSREVIAYGKDACWGQLLGLMGNVRVLHLNAPERYVRVTKLPRVGNVRIVKELGGFLELIGQRCPRLESVYFENAGSIGSLKEKGRLLKPIREALDCIDRFEERLPGVCAASLKAQLDIWLWECSL